MPNCFFWDNPVLEIQKEDGKIHTRSKSETYRYYMKINRFLSQININFSLYDNICLCNPPSISSSNLIICCNILSSLFIFNLLKISGVSKASLIKAEIFSGFPVSAAFFNFALKRIKSLSLNPSKLLTIKKNASTAADVCIWQNVPLTQ